MKKPLLSVMAAVSLLCNNTELLAANELVVNAYKNGKAAAGLTVKLDDNEEKILDKNGLVQFDLDAGSHSIQLVNNANTVHSFRFSNAQGQYADVSVLLDDNKAPQVFVDAYFKNETVVQRSKANRGRLAGQVTAKGIPVMDTQIEVSGSNIKTETDQNGHYEIQLPRGIYQLIISHPDYGTKEIEELRIVSNVTKVSNFRINKNNTALEEVLVMAKINTHALQASERYSVNVIETIGVEELARFGDTDVAAAVVRAPGITIQDSRHIFIRGLGGRYITTTLNGATLPSTDPAKRTVPLDLFPSNIVSQLEIKKTFIASMPGESTGGNLAINTKAFPSERSGKISLSIGYVDALTGEDVLVDPSKGDWDTLGWDDGTREEDITVTALALALSDEFDDFLSPVDKQELNRTAAILLKDDLDLETKIAHPNGSIGASFGDIYALGDLDGDLGIFAAVNYKNTWSQKKAGISRTYSFSNNRRFINDDYKTEEVSNNIDVSGLLSFGLTLGDSTYQSNTIISRVTESRVEQKIGVNGDSGFDSIERYIDWEERQFISQQLTGEHFLDDEGNFIADWQISFSQAKRLAPDRREVRFDLREGDGIYNLNLSNVLRRYEALTDDNIDFSTNLQYTLDVSGDTESNLYFGFQVISRERDSDSSTYGFVSSIFSGVDDNAPYMKVSDVINLDTITGDASTGIAFLEKTLKSDSYEAKMDLNSIYIIGFKE